MSIVSSVLVGTRMYLQVHHETNSFVRRRVRTCKRVLCNRNARETTSGHCYCHCHGHYHRRQHFIAIATTSANANAEGTGTDDATMLEVEVEVEVEVERRNAFYGRFERVENVTLQLPAAAKCNEWYER